MPKPKAKDVRDEIANMKALGWEYLGLSGSGHHDFEHPEWGEMQMSRSPSARGWRRSHRKRVAKAMGITPWQLDRRIAGQPEKGSPGKRPTRKKTQGGVSGAKGDEPAPAMTAGDEGRAAALAPIAGQRPLESATESDSDIDAERRKRWEEQQAELARANVEARNQFPWRTAA